MLDDEFEVEKCIDTQMIREEMYFIGWFFFQEGLVLISVKMCGIHRAVGSLAVKHGGELVISVGRHRQGGASTIPKAVPTACYPSALQTHVGVVFCFQD